MNTVIDTITSAEDQLIEAVEAAQQPVVDIVKKAVELVEGFLPEDRPSLPFVDALPKPAELVDSQFAFAKRLLETQHQFAKALIEAYAPLAGETAAPAKPTVAKATKAA